MTENQSAVEIISESLLKMFNNTFKLGPEAFLIKGGQGIIREPSIRRVNERKAIISFEMLVPSSSPMRTGGISSVLRAIHKLSLTAEKYLKPIDITMTPTKDGFECLVSIVARRLS